MGITIPDAIPYPDAGTALVPLETHFAALADGAQQAVNGLRTASTPSVATAAARNTLYPSPQQGYSVFRLDLGYTETYYSEYSLSGNPGGATPAGWYPTALRTTGTRVSGSTDGNGDVLVSHNLGRTPASVSVTGGVGGPIPDRRTYAVHTLTSTTFKVKVYRQDTGGVLPGNPVEFYWIAVG